MVMTEEDYIVSPRYRLTKMDVQHYHCKGCGALIYSIHYHPESKYEIKCRASGHYPKCPIVQRLEDPEAKVGLIKWI